MHIAMIIDTYEDDVNAGGVISTQRFVKLLREEGHQVTIIGTGDKALDKVLMPSYTISLPFVRNIMDKFKIKLAKPEEKKLIEALEDVDIVHIQFPFHLGLRAIDIAKELQKPVVSTFHVQAENITYNIGINSKKVIDKLYNFFIKKIYNRSNIVIAPSNFAKEELLRYGLEVPVEVISNGAAKDFTPLHLKRNNKQFTILSVGRLAPEKRQDLIIKALEKCPHKDIELIIVGNGSQKEKLEKLGAKVANKTTFLSNIPIQQLVELYNTADLFIHAGEVELECMTALEAITCGLPVVISNSNSSAAPQFALDEKSLFKKGDAKDLAKKISYWYEHRKELEKRRKAYEEEAKKYDINTSVQKLMEIYEQVLLERTRVPEKVAVKNSALKLLLSYFNKF